MSNTYGEFMRSNPEMPSVPETMIITGGVHTIAIRCFEDHRKRKQVLIDVTDDCTITQDIDGEWIEEHESACFYCTPEDIDKIIAKLQEAKEYLTNFYPPLPPPGK